MAYLVQFLYERGKNRNVCRRAGSRLFISDDVSLLEGRCVKIQCCLAVACVMAQGGLKAATTVVGPFEKGTVDRCLTRLKHHCIIALFSGSLSIPGRTLGDAARNDKGVVLKEYV